MLHQDRPVVGRGAGHGGDEAGGACRIGGDEGYRRPHGLVAVDPHSAGTADEHEVGVAIEIEITERHASDARFPLVAQLWPDICEPAFSEAEEHRRGVEIHELGAGDLVDDVGASKASIGYHQVDDPVQVDVRRPYRPGGTHGSPPATRWTDSPGS